MTLTGIIVLALLAGFLFNLFLAFMAWDRENESFMDSFFDSILYCIGGIFLIIGFAVIFVLSLLFWGLVLIGAVVVGFVLFFFLDG